MYIRIGDGSNGPDLHIFQSQLHLFPLSKFAQSYCSYIQQHPPRGTRNKTAAPRAPYIFGPRTSLPQPPHHRRTFKHPSGSSHTHTAVSFFFIRAASGPTRKFFIYFTSPRFYAPSKTHTTLSPMHLLAKINFVFRYATNPTEPTRTLNSLQRLAQITSKFSNQKKIPCTI